MIDFKKHYLKILCQVLNHSSESSWVFIDNSL